MATGTVKWFNNAKGYGFILPEGGGDDLFAHYSSIQMDGYKTLKSGQSVEFEIIEGPKGLQATNIQTSGTADLESMNGEPATSEVISVTLEEDAIEVNETLAASTGQPDPSSVGIKAGHSS